MSQGAEISQPSDSVTVHLLTETVGGEEMRGKSEDKIHHERIRVSVPKEFILL